MSDCNKKLATALIAATAAVCATTARGALLDFEDLTLGDTFTHPSSFNTSGVTVNTDVFTFGGGGTTANFAQVENGGNAGGSGNELEVNNVLLDFAFGVVNGIKLQFGEFGGNINLKVNGTLLNVNNFSDLPGAVGGVSITATANPVGTLTLAGNINQFAIGGQELWIDNIETRNGVPAPGTLALFAAALVGSAACARRRVRRAVAQIA